MKGKETFFFTAGGTVTCSVFKEISLEVSPKAKKWKEETGLSTQLYIPLDFWVFI